jgi:hypothetical protein
MWNEIQSLKAHAQAQVQAQHPVQGHALGSGLGQQGYGHAQGLKPMKPSMFTARRGGDVDMWINEMERYLTLSTGGGDKGQFVPYAATYLKEAASTWYDSQTADVKAGSWENFKKKLRERFRPLAPGRTARATLKSLKQQPGRLNAYCEIFLRTVQLIDDMSITDQLDIFIAGLHPRLADEVDRMDPKSLEDAMNYAQKVELRWVTRGHRSGGSSSFSQSRFASAPASSSGPAPMDLSALEYDCAYMYEEEEQEYLNAMNHRSGRRPTIGGRAPPGPQMGIRRGRVENLTRDEFDRLSKEGKCFNCKQPGHLARNCTLGRQSRLAVASISEKSDDIDASSSSVPKN